MEAYLASSSAEPGESADKAALDESIVLEKSTVLEESTVLELTEGRLDRELSSALVEGEVQELLGQHPRIDHGRLPLRLDEFLHRLSQFRHHRVPGFRRFQELRHELLEEQRYRLRLEEFKPRVMSTFVRNRLIDEVYLPLIGDNLAKQVGALGEGKRTDQMGLLLLVSPPGYGKTTLMEYVASRLGFVFMKINGPALGHSIRSLDPGEAPNATARREVEKINLAFEMGNNVLLYLDDIQHTHPELLQKFISLCDAQRKVEGVWAGDSKTYDFRGKRFAVCMAGNPYTESGETFRIPDMLANRADVYNLGEILEGKDSLFALSYIENALTSIGVLAPLAARAPGDVHLLVRMAAGEELQADQLQHPYSGAELEEILSVLRKLLAVQQVLLAVNQQYIRSAAQEAAYRTEPPFQLQGSYRNMNRLAEKIVPVMNEEELQALLDDHYQGEAQTLTGGAEHNLLKLAQLRGRMTEEQSRRWEEIKHGFTRVQAMGGAEDDPTARVVGQLGLVADRLGEIGRGLGEGNDWASALEPHFDKLHQGFNLLSREGENRDEESPKLADTVEEHLGKVSKGLDRLGRAVAGAAAEMKARPEPSAASSSNGADIAPYMERLTETMAALAEAPRGSQVVQTLGSGVHELMTKMVATIEDALLPSVRALSRRAGGESSKAEAKASKEDRKLAGQLDKTLKHLDQLKDLLAALRKIETRNVASAVPAESVASAAQPDEA